MAESHFFHKSEVINILNNVIDHTLGEVDCNNVLATAISNSKVTGIAGNIIEQSVFGYPQDNNQRPDLNIDGTLIELKTTGIRIKKENGTYIYTAKEPASITAVSINSIASETFDSSHFWDKASRILFVFYQYESVKTVTAAMYANFHIRGYEFFQLSPDDLMVVKNDWQIIHDFIAKIQTDCTSEEAISEYPNLSTIINKKTVYIDTAPKYPHPPRFRFRKRMMSYIVMSTFDKTKFEPLPGIYHSQSDIEKKCTEITNQFINQSMAQIMEYYNVISGSQTATIKQYAEQIIVKMFGGKSKKISKIDLFRKFGYIGKSITLTTHGTRTEDMKLFSADFDELDEQYISDDDGSIRNKEFEDSDLYNYFHDNKILCIIFKEEPPDREGKIYLNDNRFCGFKILDLSDDNLISEAKKTWDETRCLLSDNKLKLFPVLNKSGSPQYTPKTHIIEMAPNLPKCNDHVVFFRGTGTNALDKITIHGIKMYRQNYWIKGSYIVNKLVNIPYITL